MSPARDYALAELDARALPNWPRGLLARRPRAAPPADPRDRALAEQIIAGVIQNLLLLQHLAGHYSGRALRSIDPLVQKIVAMGLYQLRFLQRIPASAALNEAVEQARRFGRGRAGGFINAVLRNATRQPDPPLPAPDDPRAYASIVLSHPVPLYERFERLVGASDALRLCAHDNREPPTIVRLIGPDPAALSDPHAGALRITPHEHSGMYVVEHARQSTLAAWAREGVAQVQDPTAARVAGECGIEPGMTVLDRCAGLGTKTLQLWQLVGPGGTVVAIDPNRRRMQGLRRLLDIRGIDNVRVHEAGMLAQTPEASTRFDRALLDVPCSNSGVLPRRPEARYHQSPENLRSLVMLQDRILDDTAAAVHEGGLLIYSTCSLWPEENQQRTQAFLRRHPGYTLLREQATLPSLDDDPTRYHDGGYFAVLSRRPGG